MNDLISRQPSRENDAESTSYSRDTIYRQAVLNLIENYDINKYGANKYLWDLVYELPSAQPELRECDKCIFKPFKQFQQERNKGKWERYGHDFFGDNEYRCTACGETANIKTDFCPNCGADMRGEEHEL